MLKVGLLLGLWSIAQYKEFERSIETASPHRETVDWIGVTLKQVKKDYAENEKKLREMEKNPDIFRKSEYVICFIPYW